MRTLELLNTEFPGKTCVVGGSALAHLGYYRQTSDTDVFLDAENEDFIELERKMKRLGMVTNLRLVSENDYEDPLGSVLNCRNDDGLFQIIQAKYRWQKDSVKNAKDGYVTAPYMIILKLDAHGGRDIEDSKILVDMGLVDKEEVVSLIRKYGFDKKYSRLVSMLGLE